MLQRLVQPNVLNPIYIISKTMKSSDSEIGLMIITLFILVGILVILYSSMTSIINREKEEMQRDLENKRHFKEMSKASVTDDGVPANEVFKTLEESGIELNYLGGKDID